HLVERITTTVVLQRANLETGMIPHAILVRTILVHVVAQVRNEIQLFAHHVLVRCPVTLLVMLAAGYGKVEGNDHARCGRGPEPAPGAHCVARGEAAAVPACGLESANVHMNAVRELGRGRHAPGLHHVTEPFVARHFPGDRSAYPWHAALGFHGPRRKPSPYDRPVRQRIARCDTELERVVLEAGAGSEAESRRGDRGHRCKAGDVGEKVAAGRHWGKDSASVWTGDGGRRTGVKRGMTVLPPP